MRGFVVMAMFAVSLSHAGSHNYSEVRNLELDASGLSEVFVDAGAGALVVTGIEDRKEIVVVATIIAGDGDEDKARELIEKRLRLGLERDGDRAELKAGFSSGWGRDIDAVIVLELPDEEVFSKITPVNAAFASPRTSDVVSWNLAEPGRFRDFRALAFNSHADAEARLDDVETVPERT